MKTLLSSVLLLALAVPVAHAQDTQCTHCYEYDAAIINDTDVRPVIAPPDAHDVRPTTQPTLDFSKERRWVHVSGVALADGQPVPGAKVNVIAALDGGFNNYQLAVADARGVYNAWFKAPAVIRTVTVDVQSFCSTGRDSDCFSNLL